MEYRVRNRVRLRRKEIAELAARLRTTLELASVFTDAEPLEKAEGAGQEILILGSDILGFWHEGKPFLTVRGLLRYGAEKRYVTVDMGAVKFVTNGADVMGPGITDADPEVKAGDLVWIREERHQKPLAVGVALADAPVLRSKSKGKQVRTLSYVGDKVWAWGQEEPGPEAQEPEPDDASG